MKSKLFFTTSLLGLLVFLAMPAQLTAQEGTGVQRQQPGTVHYTITDLGPLPGGTFSQASFVNNNGLASGVSTVADGTQHAALWYEGLTGDIGGLGGPNSAGGVVNDRGQVEGVAETSNLDPNNENFCDYFTGLDCLPFLWQDGVMTALPLLGGNNGVANEVNSRGEIVGAAENRTRDADCPSGPRVNGTGPQVLDFEAVIWEPKGRIRKLHPLLGDTVSMAFWINDKGQAVGFSGTCANTVIPPVSAGPHAVLWERDGSVHDLGSLGGTVDPSILGVGNAALSINNRGEVVGASPLASNNINHAYLWTRKTGMQDIGTLPGDDTSVGLGINNSGDVVGTSIAGTVATGSPRAFLWRKGAMNDLNDLISDSPLYLLFATGINDAGDIAGFGVQIGGGEVHGFLASPRHR